MMMVVMEHLPVLLNESLQLLQVKPGGLYVDCTVGLGGHSHQILSSLQGNGQLIGLDRDKQALEKAQKRLQEPFHNFRLHHENFKNLSELLSRLQIRQVHGCLVDLGVSSYQLGSPERGFSFREEGPLDMRMDTEESVTAAQLVNELSEQKLAEIFFRYGEERAARKIARAIAERRRGIKFRTTRELAELVEQIKGKRPGSRLHPATQIFQALRIEVNQELAGLEPFLQDAIGHLAAGGRLVVISFHSLEDRVVKRTFRKQAGKCICFQPSDLCTCPRIEKVRILTPKPVTPSGEEVEENPPARSAKLRAAARIGD